MLANLFNDLLKYMSFSVLVFYSPAIKAVYWVIPTFGVLREETLPELFLGSKWIKKVLLQWPRMAQLKVSYVHSWSRIYVHNSMYAYLPDLLTYTPQNSSLKIWPFDSMLQVDPVGHTIFSNSWLTFGSLNKPCVKLSGILNQVDTD